ncbi:MAG: hypothetical protein GWP74_17815, partial [Proteobacteria bacterium]|nr:hypothetical protein [Pseudomonadota bacterium]
MPRRPQRNHHHNPRHRGDPLIVADTQKVQLSTSAGDIVIELDCVRAPKSSDNFLAYVDDGYYDGTIFHRVIDN